MEHNNVAIGFEHIFESFVLIFISFVHILIAFVHLFPCFVHILKSFVRYYKFCKLNHSFNQFISLKKPKNRGHNSWLPGPNKLLHFINKIIRIGLAKVDIFRFWFKGRKNFLNIFRYSCWHFSICRKHWKLTLKCLNI